MRNRRFQLQPSVDNIKEELTVHHIHLRREILKQSEVSSKRADFVERQFRHKTEMQTPYLDEKNRRNSMVDQNEKLSCFWNQNTSSSSYQKEGKVKIQSLVHHQREERKHTCSVERKNKLSVSLSMKGKVIKPKHCVLKLGGQNRQKKSMFDYSKEIKQDRTSFEVKIDQKVKQESESPMCNVVKIKQPDFHGRHLLRQEGRFNGSCLSGIIVRRTLQILNS